MNKAKNYIEQVLKGTIIAGKYIKLACKRHVDDLKQQKKKSFPFYFSEKHATGAIRFFELQRLALGDKSDQPFVLMPWQAAILWTAYGWRRKDNYQRRFVKVYIKVARGNAKTEFLAGVGNLGFFAETAKDPQIFWAATKKAQAAIGFERQKTMVQRLRRDYQEVADSCGTTKYRIFETQGVGYVAYLGQDSHKEDGFSPLYGLIDEYHAHKDDSMIHVLESGMVKRESPMMWIITTAGNNPACPCAEFEKRAKMMLDGDVQNDQLLAYMYDLDEDDDWQDEKTWCKANPSLAISVTITTLRTEYNKAITEGVQKENNFKTKNLNIWVNSSAQWISDRVFQASSSPFDAGILSGRVCFGGLDLSSSRDLTALCLFFPAQNQDEPHYCIFRFWCPEDNARERNRLDGVPYLQWARDGYLRLTAGDVIDTRYIKRQILADFETYTFHSCAYDRYRSLEMVADLNEELGMIDYSETKLFLEPFAQTTGTYNAPLQEIERMLLNRELNHGNNPIIEWMNRNVAIVSDTNGNIKFDKKRSKEKIDGMVALGMAVGQWLGYKHDYAAMASGQSDVLIL
jgi:phage terminase large subunit-like protein